MLSVLQEYGGGLIPFVQTSELNSHCHSIIHEGLGLGLGSVSSRPPKLRDWPQNHEMMKKAQNQNMRVVFFCLSCFSYAALMHSGKRQLPSPLTQKLLYLTEI